MLWAFLMAQMVKNLLAMWETWVQSLRWEDPQPTPVFLPGESPWTPWQATAHGVAKSQIPLSD